MVIELKPKCYTCLDPIAHAGPAGLTCFQGSDLDHRNKAHSKLGHQSSTHKQMMPHIHKKTKLQLEQYTNSK